MTHESRTRPKSQMTLRELQKTEEEELKTGPLSVLYKSVKNNSQVLIILRSGEKLLARVKTYDRHYNMVLERVKIMWSERPYTGKGKEKAKPIMMDRYIAKMFLRGDSVILVVRNPRAIPAVKKSLILL